MQNKQCQRCGAWFENKETATYNLCPYCRAAGETTYFVPDQMQYTVDRIEEDIVVCQDKDGNMYYFDKAFFPHDVCDGKIYTKQFVTVFVENAKATEEARQKAQNQLADLFGKK